MACKSRIVPLNAIIIIIMMMMMMMNIFIIIIYYQELLNPYWRWKSNEATGYTVEAADFVVVCLSSL